MDPIQEALDRANAARGKKPKYEAVDVDNPGFMTLRYKTLAHPDAGTEGVYFQQEALIYAKNGTVEGKPKTYDVRDAELKKMAKAALTKPGHELRGPLVEAVHKRGRKSRAKKSKGARRKINS